MKVRKEWGKEHVLVGNYKYKHTHTRQRREEGYALSIRLSLHGRREGGNIHTLYDEYKSE